MILLVVDTQKGCFNENLYLFDTVRENIKRLISLARENKMEVLYVQHDDGPGSDLDKATDNYEVYEDKCMNCLKVTKHIKCKSIEKLKAELEFCDRNYGINDIVLNAININTTNKVK